MKDAPGTDSARRPSARVPAAFAVSLIVAGVLCALAGPAIGAPGAGSSAPLGGDIVFSATEVEPDSGETTGGLRIDRGGTPSGPGIPLTDDPTEAEPTFSPDGELIAFAYDSGDLGWTGPYGIATMHADGSGLTRLTEERHDSSPAFSTDGSLVTFDRGGSIYVIGVDGTGLRQVTEDQAARIDSRPSPPTANASSSPAPTPPGRPAIRPAASTSSRSRAGRSAPSSTTLGGGRPDVLTEREALRL